MSLRTMRTAVEVEHAARAAVVSAPPRGRTPVFDWLEIAAFVALLLMPASLAAARLAHMGRRAPAAVRKALADLAEPRRASTEFAYGFAGRGPLLQIYARMMVTGLRSSSTPKVVIGRDGWLFYTGPEANLGSDAARPLQPSELAQCARVLDVRRAWLARRGIPYVVVVAPDKHHIYPEYVPPYLRPDRCRHLAQALAYVRAHTTVDILDLTPVVLREKALHPVYYRTDTHWNPLGALAGYRALMERVRRYRPDVVPAASGDFDVTYPFVFGGDLANMLDVAQQLTEPYVELKPRTPRRATEDKRQRVYVDQEMEGQRLHQTYRTVTLCPGAAIPHGVVFHDSFAESMQPLMAEHFGRLVFERTATFDRALIERERPNIVIEEFVERGLPKYTRGKPW